MNTSKTMKDIPSQKRDSIYTSEKLTHKYNSYCCPSCSAIPEILNYSEGSGTIKLDCKTHGVVTIDLQEYLEKLEKKGQKQFNNKCQEHNEQYAFYCRECKDNLCEKCLDDSKHKSHKNNIYEIKSLNPNNNELFLLNDRINSYLQKKDQLRKMIKSLDDKITFYDTLINSYEIQEPNYLLNINLKHLLYGEKLNFDEIKNINFKREQSQTMNINDFIKAHFVEGTKGQNQLTLINKNIKNELMQELINNIDNNNIFNILKNVNIIKEPKDVISLKDIKLLNLRGNKITSLNFLAGKQFPNLNILSLNDNEISSIDILKDISLPSIKELYLSKNKINDISVLSQVKMKNLSILWLSDNSITSIEVLGNVDFPRLLRLGLNKNRIKDISVFSKKKFPQLYELYLNDNEFEMINFSKVIEILFIKIKKFYY